jgi:hypothetical protein
MSRGGRRTQTQALKQRYTGFARSSISVAATSCGRIRRRQTASQYWQVLFLSWAIARERFTVRVRALPSLQLRVVHLLDAVIDTVF